MAIAELFWPLLGTWTGTEEQAASAWGPATSARAALTVKLDVGATVVVQDYRQVRADGSEFLGHGVFLLDPVSTGVLWWFFDSSALPPVPATGGWAAGALTLSKVTPRGGARHTFRVQDDELTYRIDVGTTPDEAMEVFLTGRYRRVSGH